MKVFKVSLFGSLKSFPESQRIGHIPASERRWHISSSSSQEPSWRTSHPTLPNFIATALERKSIWVQSQQYQCPGKATQSCSPSSHCSHPLEIGLVQTRYRGSLRILTHNRNGRVECESKEDRRSCSQASYSRAELLRCNFAYKCPTQTSHFIWMTWLLFVVVRR